MCSWYNVETMGMEHYKDLLREANAKKQVRMVQRRRHESGGLLRALIRLGNRVVAWGTRVQEGEIQVRMPASGCQSLRSASGR